MASFVLFEDVQYLAETSAAIFVCIEDEERWIPKSCIRHNEDGLGEYDVFDLEVVEWFAIKEELV